VRVTAHTDAGGPAPNEDWVAFTEDLVVILDGATTRTETGCHHGVAWYVRQLGLSVMREADRTDRSLVEALAAAIEQVASLHPECDLDHPGTPSAAVGVLRLRGGQLEALALADVAAAVLTDDGSVHLLTDERPDQASPMLAEALALPVNDKRRQDALRTAKQIQLAGKNKAGGYYVASSDPSVAAESATRTFDAATVQSAALLTDGAARAVDPYELTTWAGLLASLDHDGPAALIRSVRAAENSDRSTQRWPRSKPSDDATVAYAVLR
jgi:hypothetical protein